ncbi:MAG: DEAD/DEAH box helicase [Bacteriovoracaceae bacterium]
MLFSELKLRPSSLEAITKMGFTQPTEIQEKAIPVLLEGDIDFIGQAQTGTGKTAAFVLPLLEKIDRSNRGIQSLIIAPTRELANQIVEEIHKLSAFEKVSTVCIYGGASVSGQIREIRAARPQIVVGTPGRLIDFIERKILQLDNVSTVILDEADEMLDMGFFDDVKQILESVRADRKIWMFSATMPGPILELVNEHFNTPVTVKVKKQTLTTESVEQQYVLVKEYDKCEALCRMLDNYQDMYAIIFVRTKIGVDELSTELNARGYLSDSLHGDMSQDQRDSTMRRFKERKATLLVCTDVAARGIDVSDLTHVINFGLPQDNESYVHRIGRTGRGGKKGIALSIIDPSEMGRTRQIERITKAKIERIMLPKVEEIVDVLMVKAETSFKDLLAKFEDHSNHNFETFKEKFKDVTNEDVLKGLYAFIFEQSLKRYKKAREIDLMDRPRTGTGVARVVNENGLERVFLNVGRMDGLNVKDLVSYLCSTFRLKGHEIGRIDLKDRFTFFEVKGSYATSMIETRGEYYGDREISFQLADTSGRDGGGGGGRGGRGFGGGGGAGRSDTRRPYGGGNSGGGGYRGNRGTSGNTARPQ